MKMNQSPSASCADPNLKSFFTIFMQYLHNLLEHADILLGHGSMISEVDDFMRNIKRFSSHPFGYLLGSSAK